MKRTVNYFLTVAAAAGLALLLAGCPSNINWQIVGAVQTAGNATSRTIAATIQAKSVECLTTNAEGSDGYIQCIAPFVAAGRAWKAAAPVVDAAMVEAVAALQVAEKLGSGDVSWMGKLQVAACAVVGIVNRLAALVPELAGVAAQMNAVKGWVCPAGGQA